MSKSPRQHKLKKYRAPHGLCAAPLIHVSAPEATEKGETPQSGHRATLRLNYGVRGLVVDINSRGYPTLALGRAP